jgi:hypothetical protein
MPSLSDDEMVVHGDAERLCDLHNDTRHFNVSARRRRVSSGMIVHEDDAVGRRSWVAVLFEKRSDPAQDFVHDLIGNSFELPAAARP